MKKIQKYLLLFLGVLWILVGLCACDGDSGSGKLTGSTGGSGLKPVGSESEDEDEEEDELGKVYILKEVNQSENKVVLLKVGGSYREYTYSYNGGTVIEDRYGKKMLASALVCGEVFTIETNEAGDTLKELKESTKVWTYDDVKKFTLDQENEIMKINGENYHLSDDTVIFFQGAMINRYELSERDVISLIGYEKELLSVIVETGHGTLAFANTEAFENGYFVLGNVLAGQIKADVTVEVPAGEFSLSVANKGNGGKTTVTIVAGETTTVDLTPFEGGNGKTCQVTIKPAQEGMKVFINGDEVSTAEPFTLEYGLYRITATLEGYDTWSRLLMISSPEAEFAIDFGKDNSTSEEEDEEKDEDEDSSDEDSDEEGESDDEDEDEEDLSDDLTNSLIEDVLDSLLGGSD